MDSLNEAREEIEKIDKEMALLFTKRMGCAAKIAAYKKENGIPILDSGREKALIEKNLKHLTDMSLEPFYRTFMKDVMNVSKEYQLKLTSEVKVSYHGIEGSFEDIQAKNLFPECKRIQCGSFEEAYKKVENNEADYCLLPIENSFAGEVGVVTDIMFDGDLYINGVYGLSVSQCLLGTKDATLDSVKTVVSHPQALSQCKSFIEEHGFRSVESDNTARAAREVAQQNDPTVAAIGSKEAAELYSLKVLVPDINESRENTTRFGVFSKTRSEIPQGKTRTDIIMFTVKDEAGTLAKAISILGEHGYNMRVLRSRPLKSVNWQYYFYAEVDGDITTSKGCKMMDKLKKQCEQFKWIGSYVREQ
ncbi:MAG: chorismate mutase [Lachnospiraceae bacterium]|nr:chorismate mutase [Lachnospiraceae bacterium]